MKYFIISSKKNAFFFFVLPMLLFLPLGLLDQEIYPLFSHLIFGMLLVSMVLFHAIYQYVLENHLRAEQRRNILPLFYPSFSVLFLYLIAFLINLQNGIDEHVFEASERQDGTLSFIRENSKDYGEIVNTISLDTDKPLSESGTKSSDFFLPEGGDLTISQQFSAFVYAAIQEQMQANLNVNVDEQDLKVAAEFGNKLGGLIKVGNWDNIHRLIHEYSNVLPDAYSVATNLLVIYGAPISEIEQYLTQGVQVHMPATLNLIAQGRISDIERLENYGVALGSKLPLDMSMLDLALMTKLSPEGFDFLIERVKDISGFKPEIKADTLAIALLTSEVNQQHAPSYVEALLRFDGVEVTRQHEAIVSKLELSSPELAQKILEKFDLFR